MNYIDSGNRHPSQAFGTWLENVLQEDVAEVRWQSGFFSADAIGTLSHTLRRLAESRSPVHALIGSNDQGTSRAHVEELLAAMRVPRDEALLGVVAFENCFFHPKTFHVRRADGSQAGYVGSANLTRAGVTSLHVEAAITADTRDGDSNALLNTMALAVDTWFTEERPGFFPVTGAEDLRALTERGVLSEAIVEDRPPPRRATARPGVQPLPRLEPLFALPRVADRGARRLVTPTVEAVRGIVLPSAPLAEFPQYLLFAMGATVPTRGELALSGASLPAGVAGLVIRLNRDSARHFEGGTGTANISIPVAALGTFRFGRFQGKFLRPRAEFALEMRYVGNERIIGPVTDETNIMAYGFMPGETGHGDVRMVVPAACRRLNADIEAADGELPRRDDVALLEWPTSANGAVIRLTFMDRGSTFHQQASELLTNAIESGISLGQGACWLPAGFAPVWQH